MTTFSEIEFFGSLKAGVISRITDSILGDTTKQLLRPIFQNAIANSSCVAAHVWSVEPRKERLILLDQVVRTAVRSSIEDVVDTARCVTGIAFETRQPTLSRLDKNAEREYCNDELKRELGLQSLLSIPLRNIGNPHQVTYVVDLAFCFAWDDSDKPEFYGSEFRNYASLLASHIETNLRERSVRMSSRLTQSLGSLDRLTPESGCLVLATTIMKAVVADQVTIFMENWNSTSLTCRADTSWAPKATTSRNSENVTQEAPSTGVIEVWRTNREALFPNTTCDLEYAILGSTEEPHIASAILVPLHDVGGKCRGVVRCIKNRVANGNWRNPFSYEDIAVVEAMVRSFAPPLEIMLQSQVHSRSLSNLAHELRVPVVALRAVHERMEREYAEGKDWFKFRYPYFDEVHTFTSVMQRLLRQLDVARIGPEQIHLAIRPTKLLSEIIQPALRHMEPILRQHGMRSSQFDHDGFEKLPPIDVDAGLLIQVVFNLLENMVKYYPKNISPRTFSGSIVCERSYGRLDLVFTDNGSGIDESEREKIFEHGFRSPSARRTNVQGTGLGCWLAREIVRRHHGEISVRTARPLSLELHLPHPRLRNVAGL
ncbi:MAG: HAMP domain-containing histidine kinase [Planctomycetaceae bacterium]|nr:HAMP domain-containing histidine kinase [Planctomycetaceae bacterium]